MISQRKHKKKLDLLMGTAWPIPHALQHFLSILFCIIMMIVNVFTYITNDYVHDTQKVLMGLLLIISIVLCISTGISLRKRKITYK